MKLSRITVRRMPGIVDPFTIAELGPGVNLLVGPNGSGKSTTMTALRALLWPTREKPDVIDVDSTWIEGDTTFRASQTTRGQTMWQQDGAPVTAPLLPEARFAQCFFPKLSELLAPSTEDDALGSEIVKQLAGGYQVGALLAEGRFGPAARPGQAEARELQDARQKVERLRRDQHDLSERESRLGENRTRLRNARHARERLEVLKRARQRLDALEDLRSSELRLTEFPEGMAPLLGDERVRVERLSTQAREAADAESAACRHVREAESRRIECQLDSEVDPVRLAATRADAERARALERDLDALTVRLREAEGRRDQARARFGTAKVPPRTDVGSLAEIEQLVHVQADLTAERARLGSELAALGAAGSVDDRTAREAAAALRAWLAAPEPARTGSGVRVVALVAVGLLLLVAITLTILLHPAWVLLALPALGLAFAAILPGAGGADPRPGLVQRFVATGAQAPSWTRPGVESRLAELDAQLAVIADGQVRAARRTGLEASLRTVEERERTHHGDRERARLVLGIDLSSILALASLAEAVRQLGAVEAEIAGIEAQHVEVSRQHEERIGRCAELIAAFGYRSRHAEDAVAGVAGLERRCRDFRRASEQGEEAMLRAEIARQSGAERREETARLLASAGVADVADLEARLGLLGAWHAAARSVEAARGAVGEQERALSGHADILTFDAAGLTSETENAAREAGRVDSLHEEITLIEEAVRRARAADTLEAALAHRASCVEALAERRERALAAAAGRFLLQSVERQHEAGSRPAVLQKAMDNFSTFTHHSWTLAVDRAGRFRAIETASGEGRALGELSDGTRVQLMLAVRLAFAAQAEHGLAVPFVLDDALSVSDPARFDAVVASLAELALAEGRQIFYLTSQPMDAARWQEGAGTRNVHLIDLGAIRRLQRAAPDRALAPPAHESVALPGTDDAATYAARIGVPTLAPASGADAQHVYFLLHDDLPALHQLLQLRVERVGALRALLQSPAAGALPDGLRVRMRERATWFEAFVEARQQGRGKPVGRHELHRAGVSGTFLESATELAVALDGDAARLLVALREGQLKGMRTKGIAENEAWFLDNGYIDLRPVLTEAEVSHRVLAATTEPARDAAEIVEFVTRWWGWAG